LAERPVVLLTGAAGGIGRATLSALCGRGMRVFATDLALAAVPCGDPDVALAPLDVTDEAAVHEAVASTLASFGRLDHVVHLAGQAGSGPIEQVTADAWRAVLEVNLTSAFLLARAAVPALRASRGSLTLMASTNGLNGGSALSGPAYAVAKAGLINLTRYLAKEWAADGIRVNAVAPGPIDTPMVSGRFSPEVLQRLRQSVPLGAVGQPEHVAHAFCYLLDPAASFVTGRVMNVSGGVVLD